MSVEVWAMIIAGISALLLGTVLARGRIQAASGAGKVLALGPVFEAAALAVFSAEHFTAARDLMPIVPRWLPYPLFWTYLVGAALLAAAISFVAWQQVQWAASLLALLFLIIVATIDIPNLPQSAHDRFFWILTLRETSFAGGAMALAGSVWPGSVWPGRLRAGGLLSTTGRSIVAVVMVFYGVEHFLFPRFVPGVPLQKPTPAWIPGPIVIAYLVGTALVVAGVGLLIRRTTRIAASGCGIVLLLLTALFYVPISVTEVHSQLAVEGLNYIFDTMLFAATVLLAGLSPARSIVPESSALPA